MPHASLRDDYEVTGHELDTLVAAAQAHPAVLGARMTVRALAVAGSHWSKQVNGLISKRQSKQPI